MAYHGRASTIIVSGESLARPVGQTRPEPSADGVPSFGPTKQLDYELEMGYVIGGPANGLGEPIPISRARERIFGAVLLNDWSGLSSAPLPPHYNRQVFFILICFFLFVWKYLLARDIQAWESFPLGPFLGKNFATTISAWVVQAEALDLASVACEPQVPAPLAYLQDHEPRTWDVEVCADVKGGRSGWTRTSTSNLRILRWTATQMVTHHCVGGCVLRPGDLLGTGTISGEVNLKNNFRKY